MAGSGSSDARANEGGGSAKGVHAGVHTYMCRRSITRTAVPVLPCNLIQCVLHQVVSPHAHNAHVAVGALNLAVGRAWQVHAALTSHQPVQQISIIPTAAAAAVVAL
jgi:hypothetical protein